MRVIRVERHVNPDSITRLAHALDAARSGEPCVLAGSADCFCEGWDLEWLSPALERDGAVDTLLDSFAACLRVIGDAPCPIIAAVDGAALGGGLALAAAADVVIATPRARFALPEVFSGLVPAVALPYIARRVGPTRARALALGGATLPASDALHAGLCDELVEDLNGAIERHAKRWKSASAGALAGAKKLGALLGAEDYEQRARQELAHLLATEDTRRRLSRAALGAPPWEDDA